MLNYIITENKVKKHIIKTFFIRLLALLLVAVIISELPGTLVKADESNDTGITLNYTEKTIYTGKTFNLQLQNATAKVSKWWSQDESIATVDKKGKVTGVAPGTVKVKAKSNGIKYTCLVTVKDPYIKADKDYLRVGDTMTVKVKGDKVDSYKSSVPKVFSVDEDGNITAKKEGSGVLFAYCKSGKTLTIQLHVYENIKIIENPTFDDLAPTTHMTFEELVGDTGERGYPKAMPTPDTYRITVDLYWKVVMVHARDKNGNYTVPIRYMICSPGASGHNTRQGVFKMKGTRVRFSRFNGLTVWAQYWSLIVSATYFHSILYNSGNANDYTESYNKLGQAVSHGCIRLTVPDARWIYYNVAPGTEVEIRAGSSKDEETKAIREQLKLAPMPSTRTKMTAGDIPWTDNWQIDEVPQDFEYVYVPQ